jgi:hypothetical protein
MSYYKVIYKDLAIFNYKRASHYHIAYMILGDLENSLIDTVSESPASDIVPVFQPY